MKTPYNEFFGPAWDVVNDSDDEPVFEIAPCIECGAGIPVHNGDQQYLNRHAQFHNKNLL